MALPQSHVQPFHSDSETMKERNEECKRVYEKRGGGGLGFRHIYGRQFYIQTSLEGN